MDLDAKTLELYFKQENRFGFTSTRLPRDGNIDEKIKPIRFQAITSILETRSYFGLKFETVYLAIMYFDRILSQKTIPVENSRVARLISMACISAAEKEEEGIMIPISTFPDGNDNFDAATREDMLGRVLYNLPLSQNFITPFAFLPLFIKQMCKPTSPAADLLPIEKVTPFISAIMKDINLVETRPSTVAVAAILMAMGQAIYRRTELENRMSSVSFTPQIDTENVFILYELMLLNDPKSIHFDGSTSSAAARRP